MRLRAVFSFYLIFNYVFMNFGHAEDTLASLQQDVVMAKQKHAEIVSHAKNFDVSLYEKATVLANDEAMRFTADRPKILPALEPMKPLTAPVRQMAPLPFKDSIEINKPSRIKSAVPAGDNESPISFLDFTPPTGQYFKQPDEKKYWQWPRIGTIFSRKKNKAVLGYEPDDDKRITEAESLYRVAISDGMISVREAVDVGMANNIQLQAARKNIEVADSKLTEAKRGLFPTLQAQLDVNGGRVASGGVEKRFYKGRSQKLNMTQPLYYGGELSNTVKQAEENLRVSKEEYKKQRSDLVHQIRVAYYGVVKAEYNAQYQVELFQMINALLEKMKAQFEARVAAEIDYLNVQSQYQQVLFQLESSKNDVLSANVSLKQSMSIDSDGLIPVDLKMDFSKVQPRFEDLVRRALQNNFDIRVKSYGVQAAKYGIEIYESKRKPHFELRGSYGMLGETFHDEIAFEDGKADLDQEKEWFLGIQGRMPLGAHSVEYEQTKRVYGPTVGSFTGSEDWRHSVKYNMFDQFGAITDEKTAQYTLLQAETEYQTIKDEVLLRVRDEYYNLQKYMIQIDSSTAKLAYLEKQLALYDYLFNLQEVSMSDYLNDIISQAQDKYAFIQAVADYNLSLSQIGVLIGDPDYFEYQELLSKSKPKAKEEKEQDAAQTPVVQ